jgi:ABC-2 type transport system permease protein
MRQILSITRKELAGYFGTPLAIIFLGVFLAVVLFIFFSVETFFARGIADVRPLFQWMPVLLIFLIAALTMRQWSEEQRSGTLELLLTLPVRHYQLVAGKFLAVMALIALALVLTLPLPITVAVLGNLDWGPVIGGYLASLLLAAAYVAIGLFVSSRTDNQIVSLILTILIAGVLYLLGTRTVTDFVGGPTSEILWALGTGSRFESIQRGVIDLRDLVYYLSLAGVFLTLNVVSLDTKRWSEKQVTYQNRVMSLMALVVLNLLAANLWLFPLQGLRLDLTAQKEFTLSNVSRDLLENLQEPLVIRAYVSERTHPLLAPLIPQIRDMLREYEIAARSRLTAEMVDPLSDPELEAEANQTYGIRPTPFQIAGRYEASVINAYFDILVRYGDQSTIISFRDLIEVTQRPDGIDVSLRNLEYDLTSAIKKVVFGFQSVDAVLAELDEPVNLIFFVTPQTLPEWLAPTEATIRQVADEIQAGSNSKLLYSVIDPTASNSQVTPQQLAEAFAIQPIPVALFSADSFYMHLLIQSGDESQVVYPSGELTEAEVRAAIEAALKRISTGFLKVVGVWTPPETPTQDMFGQLQQPLSTYRLVRQQLGQDYTVRTVDLSTGIVPNDIDVLVVVASQNFSEIELFAIDQYLMRGGSLVLATSDNKLDVDPFSGLLSLVPLKTGVPQLLENYGVRMRPELVLDRQNMPFPIPVTRNVGGIQIQEIQAIDYPYFVEVQPAGMNTANPILANLPVVTLNWAQPVELLDDQPVGRTAEVLMSSSSNSWLRTSPDIQPNFDIYPETGFAVGADQQAYPLAVAVQGRFSSFFRGQQPPLQPQVGANDSGLTGGGAAVLEESPETARLVVIGSAAFLDDFVLELSTRLSANRYLNNLLFLQNTVDWSVEDLDLLTIRARGSFTRVLTALESREQTTWEFANYGVALLALLGIYSAWQLRKRSEQPLSLLPPEQTVSHDLNTQEKSGG